MFIVKRGCGYEKTYVSPQQIMRYPPCTTGLCGKKAQRHSPNKKGPVVLLLILLAVHMTSAFPSFTVRPTTSRRLSRHEILRNDNSKQLLPKKLQRCPSVSFKTATPRSPTRLYSSFLGNGFFGVGTPEVVCIHSRWRIAANRLCLLYFTHLFFSYRSL